MEHMIQFMFECNAGNSEDKQCVLAEIRHVSMFSLDVSRLDQQGKCLAFGLKFMLQTKKLPERISLCIRKRKIEVN